MLSCLAWSDQQFNNQILDLDKHDSKPAPSNTFLVQTTSLIKASQKVSGLTRSVPQKPCCHAGCCFTALIVKQCLQGRTGIPLRKNLPVCQELKRRQEKTHTMYMHRTFLRGDHRLGVSHSPELAETTGNHITVAREHAYPPNKIRSSAMKE